MQEAEYTESLITLNVAHVGLMIGVLSNHGLPNHLSEGTIEMMFMASFLHYKTTREH